MRVFAESLTGLTIYLLLVSHFILQPIIKDIAFVYMYHLITFKKKTIWKALKSKLRVFRMGKNLEFIINLVQKLKDITIKESMTEENFQG